jgi:RHS repeat-associated protein
LYEEDTGLVRFGARDYDPRIGRWTSKDPILFAGGQANLYVYVGNDPVNAVDVLGLLEGVPDWLLDLEDSGALQAAGDFFAGISGGLTFGASDLLIGATGLDAFGSSCSAARNAGEVTGAAFGFAGAAGITGARAGLRVVGGTRTNWIGLAQGSKGQLVHLGRHALPMKDLVRTYGRELAGQLRNTPLVHLGLKNRHYPLRILRGWL